MLEKVNFARNILLNEQRPEGVDEPPWSRYTPETFQTVALPGYAERIRKALISAHHLGDWWDITYRIEELLLLLEGERYKHLTTALDRRTTPRKIDPINVTYGNQLIPVSGGAAENISAALVTPQAPEDVPVRRRWTITAISTSMLSIEFMNTGFSTESEVLSASEFVKLDDDILFSVDPSTLVTGSLWRVESLTQPINALINSINNINNLGTDISRLFLNTERVERDDLKRIKEQSIFNNDKLLAVLLMYVYFGEELLDKG